MELICASIALSMVLREAMRSATCCPHCREEAGPAIIKWGFYWRYGPDGVLIPVQRHYDKKKCGTFSILPDALLPYHNPATATILSWLTEIFVNGTGVSTVARMTGAARSTVRGVRAKFEKTVKILRLPGHEGILEPAAFLKTLAALGSDGAAELFADWKELEPKLSIVGVYPR